MARTKESARHGGKTEKHSHKIVDKVQNSRVAKSADAPEALSKSSALSSASKMGKVDKKSKKPQKAPKPESESESEAESSITSSSSPASNASESDSASDTSSSASESASDVETKPPKVNGVAKDKVASAPKKVALSSGESSDESSASSDSEEEVASSKKTSHAETGAATVAGARDSVSTSSESESESEDDAPADAQAKAFQTPKPPVANGLKTSKEVSDDESSEGDDGSESSAGESESSEESEAAAGAEAALAKKRKAEADEEPAAKKTKTAEEAAGSKTLFVGNLSWNIDDEWLSSEFESFGEILRATIMTFKDSGKSKGFGFVEFATIEAAAKAHDEKKGQELDGRPMNVDFTSGRAQAGGAGDRKDRANQRAKQFGDTPSRPSNILFCGNLSFSLTPQKLQQAFEKFGTVSRVSLPTFPDNGQLKGFGHVDFLSTDEAQSAYDAMNGFELEGRSLRLDFATPRGENGGGSRGGFGGGRGRGGRGGGPRGRGGPRGGRMASTNRGKDRHHYA